MTKVKFFSFLISVLGLFLATDDSHAHDNSKRALPRYASIRSNEMNLRRGPGTQYPTDWVYVRAGLPIQITAEYGTWRKIRDYEGAEGWVHQAMLSGKRNFLIVSPRSQIYKNSEGQPSALLAVAERNVIGKVIECKPKMCKVLIAKHKGWINRSDIWGIAPDEEKFK